MKRRLDEPNVRVVHVGLRRVGDLRRLEVGALHEAEIRREREQLGEVALRADEVRLEHGADAVVTRLAQPPVDPERRVDDARLLHVDPHEAPEALGHVHDALDVRVRELLVELEAEMRELERDVDGQRLGVEPLEDAPVLVRDRLGLGAVADALAEQRRVGVQPLLRPGGAGRRRTRRASRRRRSVRRRAASRSAP